MKKVKVIAYQTGGWLLYLFYDWLGKANVLTYPQFMEMEFYASLVRVILLAVTAYFILYVLVEKLYAKLTRPLFISIAILIVICCGLLTRGATYAFVYCHYNSIATFNYAYHDLSKVVVSVMNFSLVICAAAMVYFNAKWQSQAIINRRLEAADKDAQPSLLKSQVQPHFIFNTLNNIYSLSVKGSSQTSLMIHRLSSLLDYMLYDSSQASIPLEKEWTYILNFIELEKIRYSTMPDIQINLATDAAGVAIAPLIILPFVENSFKHGLSMQALGSWLIINGFMVDGVLNVTIENSVPNERPVAVTGGLGIANVRKRLELVYGSNYDLKILDGQECFLVILKLEAALPYVD